MSKTILFPTDFSLLSLKSVQAAVNEHQNEKLDIVLVHGIHLSDSITDLLFFSKSAVARELSNDEFENACRLMRQLFSNINSMRTELFTGFNQSAFNAFLAGLQVDQIYIPAAELKFSHKTSMNISRFIARSEVEKVYLNEHQLVDSTAESALFSRINFAK